MTNATQGSPAISPPLRIFIDLSGHGYWYRRELDQLIEAMSRAPTSDAVLVEGNQTADCVLRIEGCPQL